MSSQDRKSVQVSSFERFLIRSLTVSSDVMGKKHQFNYENCLIEISLPDLSEAKEGYEEGARATKAGVFPEHSDSYDIHEVNITVNKSQNLLIDPQSFKYRPVASQLYTESEREKFNKVCDEYRTIAISAYEYWLTVFRWVTDDFSIGRDERLGFDSRRSTTLREKEEGHVVWRRSLSFTIEKERVVNLDVWGDIQKKLANAELPPVYLTLKHDAEENLRHGNYKVSIIELAMASEIFLRMCVLSRLPNDLDDNLVKAIEELNINQYVSKHFKKIVLPGYETEYKKIASELSSLFSKRNSIVHMGDYQGATKDNCERFLTVAESLFLFHEKIQNI